MHQDKETAERLARLEAKVSELQVKLQEEDVRRRRLQLAVNRVIANSGAKRLIADVEGILRGDADSKLV